MSVHGPTTDLTYSAAVLLNCKYVFPGALHEEHNFGHTSTRLTLADSLIEMNIALVVCSTPAFANFMRNYVMQSRIFKSLRSTLGSNNSGLILSKLSIGPNRPRTGRDAAPKRRGLGENDGSGYIDISDTLFLKSGGSVDIEATQSIDIPSSGGSGGLKVIKTFNVEHSPAPSAS